VTSFSGTKGAFFAFSQKQQNESAPKFFFRVEEKALVHYCIALKSNALGL